MNIAQVNTYGINLPLLMKAIAGFERLGYIPLSVPYLVDKDIVELTLPENKVPKRHRELYYVGSAEQSFYQVLKCGAEPNKKYMMLTPCQRDEDVYDDTHLEIFLKLELVSMFESPIDDVMTVYNELFGSGLATIVGKSDGTDIEIAGIEVGSFGKREVYGKSVYFGTGLAMPRINYALSKCNRVPRHV